jgi:hypothetical protein
VRESQLSKEGECWPRPQEGVRRTRTLGTRTLVKQAH